MSEVKDIIDEVEEIIDNAIKGDPHSQYQLGMIYYWGGVYKSKIDPSNIISAGDLPRDYKKYHSWILQAALQNHGDACMRMSHIYEYGLSEGDLFICKKNEMLSEEWRKKAIENMCWNARHIKLNDRLKSLGVDAWKGEQ